MTSRLARVLAVVAALAFVLVPTLARAVAAAGGGAPGALVCTPQGLQPAPSDAPAPAGVHLDACALCALGTGGAPAPEAGRVAPPAATRAAAGRCTHGVRPHATWRTGAPRAPPAQG